MPRQVRCDLISLFDINFAGERFDDDDLASLRAAADNATLERQLGESRQWVFDEPRLARFERYCLPPKGRGAERGASLLLNSEFGVGVFFVWTQHDATADPLILKDQAWTHASMALKRLETLLPQQDYDRHFPFISLLLSETDASDCMGLASETVGRLLSGGYAHERLEWLQEIGRRNISRRDYERLLLTWSDTVALYRDDSDTGLYERSMLRAVQLFETCIAVRRMLLSIGKRADALLPTISWWHPHPLAVNRLVEWMRTVERECMEGIAPASVEGQALIEAGYREFGLARILEQTRPRCEALERRTAWAKGQGLIVLGVATYLLDKLKVFNLLPWSK